MSARLRAMALAALGVAAIACADVGDPDAPASLAWSPQRLPSTAILLRDTLRDTLGQLAPVNAVVFDADDDPIADFPVEYTILDTAKVRRDEATGYVISTDTTTLQQVRIQARAGGLIAAPLAITIVPAAPDTLRDADSASTLPQVLLLGTDLPAGTALRAVRAVARRGTTAVGNWFVEYRILSRPPFVDSAWFAFSANDTVTRAAAQVDTTDGSGIASRFVRARRRADATTGEGTIVVRTRFRAFGRPTDSLDFAIPVAVNLPAP